MLPQAEQAHETGANPPWPGFAREPLHAKPGAQCTGYFNAWPGAVGDCAAARCQVVTANAPDGKQHAHPPQQRMGAAVAVVEHRADELHLPDIQRRAADEGGQ
eukprot:3161817-Pyramimonas_sp.AAC.1